MKIALFQAPVVRSSCQESADDRALVRHKRMKNGQGNRRSPEQAMRSTGFSQRPQRRYNKNPGSLRGLRVS